MTKILRSLCCNGTSNNKMHQRCQSQRMQDPRCLGHVEFAMKPKKPLVVPVAVGRLDLCERLDAFEALACFESTMILVLVFVTPVTGLVLSFLTEPTFVKTGF